MMLGSRFSVGSPLPRGLSDQLGERIRVVEAGLSEDQRAKARWTLTWLEGRAIVELDGGPRLVDGQDGPEQTEA